MYFTITTCKSTVLTTFWFDNFDQNIETSTGHGTIHNTHGVVYQEESVEAIRREYFVDIPRSKRRTIVSSNQKLNHRKITTKTEPPLFGSTQCSIPSTETKEGCLKLTVWKIVRQVNMVDQTIPRYKGWLTSVSREQLSKSPKTVITYLPVIHAQITEYATVVEYITQAQKLADQVNMQYVHMTLDVGVAAKAFHATWNYAEEFNNVIIHLGDFHLFQKILEL